MLKLYRKILVVFLLGSLMVSAFFMRWENYQNAELRAIDEMVYVRLATQMAQDFFDYSPIPYGLHLQSRGRDLPDYFFQPIFKHPPLFSASVTGFIKVFGNREAIYIMPALLFGLLLIPLVYLFAKEVYGWKVGVLAALIMWLDPVTTICTQKIFMSTSLAFWALLAVYMFCRALNTGSGFYFLLAGIATGLGLMTKYTGILPLGVFVLYAVLVRRDLFKNRSFWMGLITPFVMSLPWIAWNYAVYKEDMFLIQLFKQHPAVLQRYTLVEALILGACIALGFIALMYLFRIKKNQKTHTHFNLSLPRLGLILFFLVLLFPYFLNSLSLFHIPLVSWSHTKFFPHNQPLFYFGRLLEYFPIYLFGLIALFTPVTQNQKNVFVLHVSVLIIALFFILWRNYQMRYFLPAIPFLVILTAGCLGELLQKCIRIENRLGRFVGVAGLFLFVAYCLVKVQVITLTLIPTHNFCYF